MSKTRDFVEEIDAHFFPEFGGFRTIPYSCGSLKGVEVIKEFGGYVIRKAFTWDEIRASRLSGEDLANIVMHDMHEEFVNIFASKTA